MSLPVPNLDDRSFQSIVDEAKRLIPTHCPEWTNHNVSDPGVALIELFAWMTEMAIFRLNQVPDAFYTRMLNLLGLEQFPARAAQVPITFWLTSSEVQDVAIPAGTQVATDGTVGDQRTFTTIDNVILSQPKMIGALTSTGVDNFTNVWEDLRLQLKPITCFTSSPLTHGDCFYFGFEQSLAGNVIELDIRANVEGRGVKPSKPPLRWDVWDGAGWIEVTVPTEKLNGVDADTTGGLNRDGRVVLQIPAVHEPLALAGEAAFWLRGKLMPADKDRPMYQSSPRLEQVIARSIGGVAIAEHSVSIHNEVLGTSTGKPDQVFLLGNRPVLPRTEHEYLEITTATGTQKWEEVDDFVRSDSDDRHYVIDPTTGEVHFGPLIRYPDGTTRQNGAVPAEDARIVMTSYRSGGGNHGNVGVGKINTMRTTIPYVSGAVNLVASKGGVDAESVDNAKLRGPMSIRAGKRAVTADDYEALAKEADSGVARVRCLPPQDAGGPIRLLIVPNDERPPEQLLLDNFAITDRMMRRVSDYLDERRILGAKVEISTPYFQGVTVAALVSARRGAAPELIALVQQRVSEALYKFINPLTGGTDGKGWPFDANLNAATILHLLENVEGVDRVDDVLLFDYDLRNQNRVGFGKEMLRLDAHSLFLSSNHQVVVR